MLRCAWSIPICCYSINNIVLLLLSLKGEDVYFACHPNSCLSKKPQAETSCWCILNISARLHATGCSQWPGAMHKVTHHNRMLLCVPCTCMLQHVHAWPMATVSTMLCACFMLHAGLWPQSLPCCWHASCCMLAIGHSLCTSNACQHASISCWP